jgi:hypothetical protein
MLSSQDSIIQSSQNETFSRKNAQKLSFSLGYEMKDNVALLSAFPSLFLVIFTDGYIMLAKFYTTSFKSHDMTYIKIK